MGTHLLVEVIERVAVAGLPACLVALLHAANVTLLTVVPTGKVELHGKVIEVDYSVPKKLR